MYKILLLLIHAKENNVYLKTESSYNFFKSQHTNPEVIFVTLFHTNITTFYKYIMNKLTYKTSISPWVGPFLKRVKSPETLEWLATLSWLYDFYMLPYIPRACTGWVIHNITGYNSVLPFIQNKIYNNVTNDLFTYS